MSIRPFRDIIRRKTKVINVGGVKVGGDNPISVQSMTNTLTTDVKATVKQIVELQNEGADLVRVSCPDEDSTKALKQIIKEVDIPKGYLIRTPCIGSYSAIFLTGACGGSVLYPISSIKCLFSHSSGVNPMGNSRTSAPIQIDKTNNKFSAI